MKKFNICLFFLFVFPLLMSLLIAQQSLNKYQPPTIEGILGLPKAALLNISNMSSWQYNDGRSGIAPNGYAGIIYPRGTASVVFQDGFIWGGFTQDPNSPQLRVGGQTYRVGTQGGRIISIGNAEDPNAPHVRIYKIRPDYLTLTYSQLRQEAAEFFMIPLDQVTLAMTDSLISQYTKHPENLLSLVDEKLPLLFTNPKMRYTFEGFSIVCSISLHPMELKLWSM